MYKAVQFRCTLESSLMWMIMFVIAHLTESNTRPVIPCIVYVTSSRFTPTLQRLWTQNMKDSLCALRFFNNTDIIWSVDGLGIAPEVHSVRPWAFKIDLWRYAQLGKFGGMFFDAELELNLPPERIFDLQLPRLQIPLDRDRRCLYNAMMASPPGDRALDAILSRSLSNVRARSYGHSDSKTEPWLGITGPCTAGRAISSGEYKVIGRHIAPHTVDNSGMTIGTNIAHVKNTFTDEKTHYGSHWSAKTIYT